MTNDMRGSGHRRQNARRVVFGLGGCGALLALAACTSAPLYQQWGSMREVLHDGETQARVVLTEAAITHESYGVGALSELAGEITIDGGRVWVSRSLGPGDVATTTGVRAGDAASMLFLGRVSSWTDTPITSKISPVELDRFLADAFADRGAQTGPVPFRIEGEFTDVRLHVIAGQCPIRARMHGEAMTKPAFELTIPRANATVVGIYAADAAGDVTHMGSDTHMHIIVEHDGRLITGHIESIGVLPGSTLQLPTAM